MSVIGLRVGPFEIVQPATVPATGDWYRARRAGMTRRQPEEVLVRLLPSDADGIQRAALQTAFHNLRAVEDARIPSAVALYEGIGALAIDAPEGASLGDVIEARAKGTIALTPATLLDIALEIAETLQHAHHRNRFHGHLEPATVRLTGVGKLFLFGFEEPEAKASDAWRSPEEARGEAVGPAADQWALGVMIAGLIAGVRPWDEHAAVDGNTHHLVDPIEQQWPALARLVRRMLESDPANRHPSMHPVRQELLALARKAGGSSERLELGKAMARRLGMNPPTSDPEPGVTEVATQVLGAVETSAETLVDRAPTQHTEESMNLPEPGIEPPPVVERVEPEVREPTPLVAEAMDVVAPAVVPDDVPQLRRDGEPPVLAPADFPADETVDDAPTERVNLNDMHEDDDFDLPDGFDDDSDVHSALAIAPGEGPTAVPYTDPGEIDSLVDSVPPLQLTPEELEGPSGPSVIESPVVQEIITEASEPAPAASSGLPIQKIVPVLVGVMVLLMIGYLLWS